MKRTYKASTGMRIFSILLTILIAGNSLALPVRAADWAPQISIDLPDQVAGWTAREILDGFAPENPSRPNYDDSGFLMAHKDMALLVKQILSEHGYNADVIYDDEDSTANRKEYILMCTEKQSKNLDFLPLGVNMNVNRTGDARDVHIYLLTSQWKKDQIARFLPALAAVYEALHGNMTDEERQNLVVGRRLTQTESGFTAFGNFDGLYYAFSFSEETVSLRVTTSSGADKAPFAVYYSEPHTFYGTEGYTIRSRSLTMTEQGDLRLELELINESRNPLLFHMTHVMAGGYDIPAAIYTEVSPGNTKTESIQIDLSMLTSAGTGEILDICPYYRVTDQKTKEILYDYRDVIPVGIVFQSDCHKHRATLFRNDEFHLSVIGSQKDSAGSAPAIYLLLENGVYGNVLIETEGNCVVGKQEYDLYGQGFTSGYGNGLAMVRPQISQLGKNTKIEFDLQLSSYNYNPMVAGRVSITLDSEGKILRVSGKMKETSQYDHILGKEY